MDLLLHNIGMVSVLAFIGLTLYAAFYDLADLTIPNSVQVALIAVFLAASASFQIGWATFGMHLFVGFVALIITMILFSFGAIGGGDAKMIAVCCMWFGYSADLANFAMMTALAGGALAIVLLVMHRMALPVWLYRLKGIPQLGQPNPPVPYGIAICIGVVVTVPKSVWFQYAWG